MYKEIAIDPACMGEFDYYQLLKLQFGFDKGRYVSADIKSWADEAFHIVKESDLPDVKKKSVKHFLNQVKSGQVSDTFLLTNERKSIKAQPWREWWKAQSELRAFSVSVSKTCEDSIIYDDILNGCDQWEVSPSISVERNSALAIVKAIKPLIYLSEEITLVDPYFTFESKNKTLIELLKVVSQCSVKKFTVVTSMGSPDVKGIYSKEFKSLKISLSSFDWIIVDDKFFHDRYLLTHIGAVKAGHGFMTEIEKGTPADMLNLNIVSKKEANRTSKEIESITKTNKATIHKLID